MCLQCQDCFREKEVVLILENQRRTQILDQKYPLTNFSFLFARQQKLAKMTSPAWQFFKVSEKERKSICNVWQAEISHGVNQGLILQTSLDI